MCSTNTSFTAAGVSVVASLAAGCGGRSRRSDSRLGPRSAGVTPRSPTPRSCGAVACKLGCGDTLRAPSTDAGDRVAWLGRFAESPSSAIGVTEAMARMLSCVGGLWQAGMLVVTDRRGAVDSACAEVQTGGVDFARAMWDCVGRDDPPRPVALATPRTGANAGGVCCCRGGGRASPWIVMAEASCFPTAVVDSCWTRDDNHSMPARSDSVSIGAVGQTWLPTDTLRCCLG